MGVQLSEVFHVFRVIAFETGLDRLPHTVRNKKFMTSLVSNISSVRV